MEFRIVGNIGAKTVAAQGSNFADVVEAFRRKVVEAEDEVLETHSAFTETLKQIDRTRGN